jgi:hypothetical protein
LLSQSQETTNAGELSSQTLLTERVELPHYLRSSTFAKAIDGEDCAIEVPANCFKGYLNTCTKDDREGVLVPVVGFY